MLLLVHDLAHIGEYFEGVFSSDIKVVKLGLFLYYNIRNKNPTLDPLLFAIQPGAGPTKVPAYVFWMDTDKQ